MSEKHFHANVRDVCRVLIYGLWLSGVGVNTLILNRTDEIYVYRHLMRKCWKDSILQR